MKKLILLLFTAVMMIGCIDKNTDGSVVLSDKEGGQMSNPSVCVIDSCEYISWGYGLAHKGNCKYCAARRQKELEELVIKLKEK